jgi:DNA (cytosine-5)-methyltransferase 1
MIYGSVCSGIEAATAAWHVLGWQAAWYSEIEPFPSAVLAHHYPETPNLGDMTKFKEWPDHAIDLLVGGTPCQSFSVAGLRKGLDDPRGNLMLTFGAIAGRYRPRWLVWENVPGVLSSNKGKDFGSFLGLLTGQHVSPPADGWSNSGILSGYKNAYGLAWRILDAQYLGVPQRRRRVFVVGYLGDWRPAAAVLFERHSLQGDTPPGREAGKAVAGLTATGVGTCGADDNQAQAGHLIPFTCVDVAPTLRAGGNKTGGDRPPGTDVDTCETIICMETGQVSAGIGIGTTLNCNHEAPIIACEELSATLKGGSGNRGWSCDDGAPLVAHSLRGEGFDASEDGTGRGTPLVPVAFSCKDSAADAGALSPTLRSMNFDASHANGGGQVAVAFAATDYKNGKFEECTVSRGITTSADRTRSAPIVGGSAVRRLTPRECERLQGFPDDYTLIPWRGKKREDCPDGPRYKALGNSMAVPVMHWIGQRIETVNALQRTENAS